MPKSMTLNVTLKVMDSQDVLQPESSPHRDIPNKTNVIEIGCTVLVLFKRLKSVTDRHTDSARSNRHHVKLGVPKN